MSGAGYAIYWTNVNGKLAVAGDFTSTKRKEALRKRGLEGSFAIESERYAVDVNSEDPTAECFRVRCHTLTHAHVLTLSRRHHT